MTIVRFFDTVPCSMSDMIDYCHHYSLSLVKFEETDVSDVSSHWDTIFAFEFEDDSDAIVFKLRYNGI